MKTKKELRGELEFLKEALKAFELNYAEMEYVNGIFLKAREDQEKEMLERVEKLMLENILYIGDEIPSAIMEDKRSKFILLGFPGKFLSSLKGKRRAIK